MHKREAEFAAYRELIDSQKRLLEIGEGERINEVVGEMLRQAVEQNATRIILRKRPLLKGSLPEYDPGYPCSNGGRFGWFTIEFELGGNLQRVGGTEMYRWRWLISRLKVIANVIDYGFRKSVNSTFNYDLGEGRTATFLLTTNPNPFLDEQVVIEVQDR